MRDPSLPPDDIAGNGDPPRRPGPVPGGRRPSGGPYQGPAGAYRRPVEHPVPDPWRPAGALSSADQPPEGRVPYEAPDVPQRRGPVGTQDGNGDEDGTEDGKEPRGGRHSSRRKGKGHRSVTRTIVEWVVVIGGGIVIALVIEAFLIQAFWIPSPSMVPTLEVGDRVLVNKLSYRLHDVNHGDVVVFERPESVSGDQSIKDLIKRVIAVGGDTIEARNGLVYLNGERLDESDYLPSGTVTDDLPPTEVPEGQVFVMGDNRTDSQDSRSFGPIPEDSIVGRAFVKVLPLSDISWL